MYMKPWMFMLLAFLGGCSFGILSTFVKFAYAAGFTPAEVVGSQFFCGSVLLLIVVLIRRGGRLPLKMAGKLLLSGCTMAITGLCYYQSLKYLDASIAIIMLFQFSWMGLIAEWILDRRMPDGKKWLSALLLFIGSLFAVNIVGASFKSLSMAGSAWGLAAAVTFTAFIFVSGRVGADVPAVTKSLYMSIGALILVSIVFPPAFIFNGTLFGDGLIRYGLFLGLFGVVLPPLLFSISMPKIGSGLGTILSSSELPTAVFMSMAVLKEYVSLVQWIGVLIVLVGISLPGLLQMYGRRPKQSGIES